MIHISRQTAGPAIQFRSARGFEWTRLEVSVADLPPALNGLRIVHLGDFHCRKYWDPAYDELISRLTGSPPDLIIFSGDFVESKVDARPAMPVVRRLFSQLRSRLGTFAILGNHDGDLVGAALAGCGITLIDHRRVVLEGEDAAIELIGLPGVDRKDLDLRWADGLGKKSDNSLRVVACHFPDLLLKTEELSPDLYLAGHTHGGQVCLPGGVPILRHDSLPRELCTGIHQTRGTVLVVNRGFGFSSPLPLRLFCPAEVVEIVVVGAGGESLSTDTKGTKGEVEIVGAGAGGR